MVGVADLFSLGHLSLTCKFFFPATTVHDTSSVSNVKSGSKVDSLLARISCMRNAPAKAKVETDQMSNLSCSDSWLRVISL